MSWNFIVARMNGDGTKTILDYEVPIQNAQITSTLSGPDGFTGTITPEVKRLMGSDGRPLFDPWSTAIFPEEDGVIRGGALLIDFDIQGPNLGLDCIGFTGYAAGMPYMSSYSGVQVDPADVFRLIWAHIQGRQDGNLGIVVDDAKTKTKIGTKSEDVEFVTGSGENVQFEAGPYKLAWWQTHDLSKELDDLARMGPFDYRMEHAWASEDGEPVSEVTNLAYKNGTGFHTSVSGSWSVGGPLGTDVARATRTGTGATAIYMMQGDRTNVVAGERYYAAAWVRVSVAGNYDLRLPWNGNTTGPRRTYYLPANEWRLLTITETAPAGTATTGLDIVTTAGGVGDWFEMTAPVISTDPIKYGDGDDAGWEWTGAAHASPSRRLPREANEIVHRLRLGVPRLGKRRHDLSFIVGENCYVVPTLGYSGADYASDVLLLGAGEGSKIVHNPTVAARTGRLRRVAVLEDKTVRSSNRAKQLAVSARKKRAGDVNITELEVLDHPHARLGSVQLGDQILVQHDGDWGSVAVWCRVLEIVITPEQDSYKLSLARVEKVT